jgi:hypothetical protein
VLTRRSHLRQRTQAATAIKITSTQAIAMISAVVIPVPPDNVVRPMSGEMGSDRHFAQQQSSRPNVRFWHKADITTRSINVRF